MSLFDFFCCENTTSSEPMWTPQTNTDGTPMIQNSFVDANGDQFCYPTTTFETTNYGQD